MKVKDLLHHDLPPTNADAQMRREHTLGSIQHQVKHFSDHGNASVEQLRKLYTVDSKKAKHEAQRVSGHVDKVGNKVKQLMKGWRHD